MLVPRGRCQLRKNLFESRHIPLFFLRPWVISRWRRWRMWFLFRWWYPYQWSHILKVDIRVDRDCSSFDLEVELRISTWAMNREDQKRLRIWPLQDKLEGMMIHTMQVRFFTFLLGCFLHLLFCIEPWHHWTGIIELIWVHQLGFSLVSIER